VLQIRETFGGIDDSITLSLYLFLNFLTYVAERLLSARVCHAFTVNVNEPAFFWIQAPFAKDGRVRKLAQQRSFADFAATHYSCTLAPLDATQDIGDIT